MIAYRRGVEERLRAAEIARAEAQARAAEERKRRRLAIALASTILLAIALGGGVWFRLETQRQQRERQISSAYNVAVAARARASGLGNDLAAWSQARSEADAALRLLRTTSVVPRLQAEIEDLAQSVGLEADRAEAEAEEARRDRELIDRLVEIRSSSHELGDEKAVNAYQRAFQERGMILSKTEADSTSASSELERAAAVLANRPREVLIAAASGLDDWAILERQVLSGRKTESQRWTRQTKLAARLDPDEARVRFRQAMLNPSHEESARVFAGSLAEADLDRLAPPSLVLLANLIGLAGHPKESVRILKRGSLKHPQDIWIQYRLGFYLEKLGPAEREQAVVRYRIAYALHPSTGHELAHRLIDSGENAEAAEILRTLTRRQPESGRHWGCLSTVLQTLGSLAEARQAAEHGASAFREALKRDPRNADAHSDFGLVLLTLGKVDEAIAEERAAVRLEPEAAGHYSNLGVALKEKQDYAGAIAAYREAIRLDPKFVFPRNNLGNVLRLQGDLPGAAQAFRDAIAIEPDYFQAQVNLAFVLTSMKQLDEAAVVCREAIRLKPDSAAAYNHLGNILKLKRDWDGAIAAYRKSLELNPNYSYAHVSLALVHRVQKRYVDAVAELEVAHKLQTRRPPDWPPTDEWLADWKLLAAMQTRLPALLSGTARPKDPRDALAIADYCYEEELYCASAQFYSDAFAADPKLADDLDASYRYNASCSAILAGSDADKTLPPCDSAARARLRTQALSWLKVDVEAQTKRAADATVSRQVRAKAIQSLAHMREDSDLSAVRDPDALAQFPESDRKAWQAFWSDLSARLESAKKE